jgi:hypothetical protein
MPLTPALEKRIEAALDEAIELAEIGSAHVPAHRLAQRIYETEVSLMEEASRAWVIERLTWMITRRRRARWDQKFPHLQMCLPDPVFQGLPKTVFLRNGERPKLLTTTLTQTEDHLKLLRERFKHDPRVRQFEAVVELHRKWAAIERGITLGDAMMREAKERENL